MPQKEINDILEKYKRRLSAELGDELETDHAELTSREYEQFKADILPDRFTFYEKMCNLAEKIVKLSPDKAKVPLIEEQIATAHLNVTPTGVMSLSIIVPLAITFIGIFLAVGIPFVLGGEPSFFFVVFALIAALSVMFPLQKMPDFLANTWRLSASNQMVLCIFYIVTYMRHTSNLELALEFASNHLSGPLALDLKKVLWDIETEKYSNLKESLDRYLESWRKYNMEFVEAIHLIESSLYEPSEARRLDLLDKSLDVILEETFEKMLHYAQNLKSPITTLYMLGITLPILGLVILPLVVNFIASVKWYYFMALYNVALPILVYYLGATILAQRPTGYGDTDISQDIPELQKYKNIVLKVGKSEVLINPLYMCVIIGVVLFMVSLAPLFAHMMGMENIGFGPENENTICKQEICALTYTEIDEEGNKAGPFDLVSTIFSLLVPLSLSISIGLYYHLKSQNLVKIREDTKRLEGEFAAALFQLGNRLGDGLPAEVAFEKTAIVLEGTEAGSFFQQVTTNIKKLGMSVSTAIFDPKIGAITSFPSRIIESSMKVLIQAVKKGPKIAAQALINISRYIKEMHRVNERLKDLLSEVITSMKSQTSLLTPLIAGIVVGITSMITLILSKLPTMLQNEELENEGMASAIPDMFEATIPTYYFQIVVGLYVVQIVYIMTILANGIENGTDKLNENYTLGKNMLKSGALYVFVALLVTVILNVVADLVLSSM